MPAWVRQPNTFIDPAGVKAQYQWTINHEKEEEVDNSRGLTDGAPTSDIGLLPQQGPPKPLKFTWEGKLFTQADKNAMDSWWVLCESQSIYLIDFAGSEYEIVIEDWKPKRVGVAWNKRGQIPFLWEYTIVIRVLTVLSGDFLGRTP